ncbi:hypothetical protein CYMTET_37913 [Cymbomonas tetramitiformis]|uniref:Uncharacterized protein n=2 Tax=Cymbomonas tetramitiformis TaxID=36881 RepID=A0AAE0CCY6_9CHLO|nr:hypothetical protein CYMTET_37913 [Cymbomonas tetramitiformis]
MWWHALLLEVDGVAVAMEAVPKSLAQASVELQRVARSYMHMAPSTDREAPGVAELFVHLPAGAASARLSVPFDKAFLHVDEYMPDANHGFDIEGAMVTVELLHTPAQGRAMHEQNW